MATYEINGNVVITQGATLDGTERINEIFRASFHNEVTLGVVSARYNVDCRADIRNVRVNDDSSVELDFYGITAVRAYTTFTTGASGVTMVGTLYGDKNNDGNLQKLWESTIDLAGSFDTGWIGINGSAPQHLKIPAGEQVNIPLRRVVRWYGDASYSDDEFYVDVGGFIKNPIETYRPASIRKSGSWVSINKTKRKLLIRQGGWQDKSVETFPDKLKPNKGHTRIRRSGNWLQAPPM